jgi:L-fucose isomerase-like protein
MAKIELIALGHEDYKGKSLDAIFMNIGEILNSENIYKRKIQTIVTTSGEAVKAVRAILPGECDGVILLLASWVECPVVMTAIKELNGLPFILWGFTPEEVNGELRSTGSYVSGAMLNGLIKRLNLHSRCLLGSFRDPLVITELKSFAAAAGAVQGLKYSSIGLVGYTSMGIYPGTFDHVLMRYIIGPEIDQIDSYTLIRGAEELSGTEIEEAIQRIRSVCVLPDNAPSGLIRKTASIYAALKRTALERQWNAFNLKCQYEFSKEFGAVPCVPLSLLADEGFVSACEGDIPCTVTMLLLHYLTGSTVTYADALSHQGNRVKFSACGFLPFSMGTGRREIGLWAHPGFKGMHCRFVMPAESVTFARLVEDIGTYHLIYGTGQGKETILRDGCMPALDVELDGSIADMVREYAGQHYALCYGDLTKGLEAFALLMGINAIRI